MFEKAAVLNNNSCSACAIGAICLIDGPIPDAEIAGLTGIFGIWG